MTYSESLQTDLSAPADRPAEKGEAGDSAIVAAILGKGATQNELYVRYRRPLMQVFHQRHIDRDAAQDLLQRTFLQAIKKIRSEGLDDPSNLGGYLYRTACKLAAAYWRGELSRKHENDRELLSNLRDEAMSLEERVDNDMLANCVRELISQLPVARDREVLERFYLREEPRTQIRDSLSLTELQFNQVLWRARQRFGDILRRHGFQSVSMAAAQTTD